jgi:hypothetical protein
MTNFKSPGSTFNQIILNSFGFPLSGPESSYVPKLFDSTDIIKHINLRSKGTILSFLFFVVVVVYFLITRTVLFTITRTAEHKS